jgi:hypothetical protein
MRKTTLGPLLLGASLVMAACSGDDAGGADASPPADAEPPLFPDDYRDSWVLSRDCRSSTSHDLHKILVWADPDAAAIYNAQEGELPVGAVLLKEEFDFGDIECEGEVIRRTVMKKLPADSDAPAEQLGWYWADYEADGTVASENHSLCYGCHDDCDGEPGRVFDDTCAVP